MPLRSDVVGESLRPLVLEVTPRRALAFAAGLGDVSAASLDDAAPGFVASPLLCVSLEWQSVIGGRNALLGLSDEEGRRGVHAGQDTRFLAPLPVGRKVRVEGRVVTVRRTPAGALSTSRIHVRDSRSGRLISTTLSTAIYRGVAVEGDDHSIEPPDPAVAPDAGEDWAETTIPLDRGFAHRYSECADIWNPIHTERSVALAAGLADIIVHGSALWALAGLAVTRGRGGGSPDGSRPWFRPARRSPSATGGRRRNPPRLCSPSWAATARWR